MKITKEVFQKILATPLNQFIGQTLEIIKYFDEHKEIIVKDQQGEKHCINVKDFVNSFSQSPYDWSSIYPIQVYDHIKQVNKFTGHAERGEFRFPQYFTVLEEIKSEIFPPNTMALKLDWQGEENQILYPEDLEQQK